MTPETFRKMALALPETCEAAHGGHPDFRLGKKVFASLGYPDNAHGMVKLTPEQQQRYMSSEPAVFSPAAGAWGRGGSSVVTLRGATQALVRQALRDAWRNVATPTLLKKHRDKV